MERTGEDQRHRGLLASELWVLERMCEVKEWAVTLRFVAEATGWMVLPCLEPGVVREGGGETQTVGDTAVEVTADPLWSPSRWPLHSGLPAPMAQEGPVTAAGH